MTNRPAVYLGLAFVAAVLSATMQGFDVGNWHWIGAVLGGPVFGLGVGLLKSLNSRTDVSRWVLVGSLATLALTGAGAQCAMCFFVTK